MPQPPPQLDYAPPPPWPSRRAARRVALLCFLILSAWFAVHWAGHLSRRIQANYHFRQCLSHQPAPDTIVYQEKPEGRPTGHVAPPWSRFYAHWSQPGLLSYATLFVHERCTSDGRRRLVTVDLPSPRPAGATSLRLCVRVFEPPAGLSSARLLHAGSALALAMDEQSGLLRFRAGQPDPADPSHFTITYLFDQREGIIDGWLMAGDTVELEVRRGRPSTAPAPPSPATSP